MLKAHIYTINFQGKQFHRNQSSVISKLIFFLNRRETINRHTRSWCSRFTFPCEGDKKCHKWVFCFLLARKFGSVAQWYQYSKFDGSLLLKILLLLYICMHIGLRALPYTVIRYFMSIITKPNHEIRIFVQLFSISFIGWIKKKIIFAIPGRR